MGQIGKERLSPKTPKLWKFGWNCYICWRFFITQRRR